MSRYGSAPSSDHSASPGLRCASFSMSTSAPWPAGFRLLGVDAAYESTDIGDPALAARSAAERRVLLSRDRGLLHRRELWAGGFVYSTRPDDQLRDVLGRFAPELKPWTRCTACNGLLAEATKEQVADRLEGGTERSYDVFAQCGDCGRAYWKGAHHDRLETVVERALAEFGT